MPFAKIGYWAVHLVSIAAGALLLNLLVSASARSEGKVIDSLSLRSLNIVDANGLVVGSFRAEDDGAYLTMKAGATHIDLRTSPQGFIVDAYDDTDAARFKLTSLGDGIELTLAPADSDQTLALRSSVDQSQVIVANSLRSSLVLSSQESQSELSMWSPGSKLSAYSGYGATVSGECGHSEFSVTTRPLHSGIELWSGEDSGDNYAGVSVSASPGQYSGHGIESGIWQPMVFSGP